MPDPCLRLETWYVVLNTCHVRNNTVYKFFVAIESLHLARDPEDPFFILVKFIKGKFVARYEVDDHTRADADCQPQHIDEGIDFLPLHHPPCQEKVILEHTNLIKV